MNTQTEENTIIFPTKKGFSDLEKFIDSHDVMRDGAIYFHEGDDIFGTASLDFSKYSGIQLNIHSGSLLICENADKRGFPIEKDFLKQEFFNDLVSEEKNTPELMVYKHKDFYDEERQKKIGDTVSINCTFYPIAPLGRSLLYKVDVAVKICPNIPRSAKSTEYEYRKILKDNDVIVNFLQKYFVVDKEGMFFEKQAKAALKKCFDWIPEAFTETKDNKIYVVKEYEYQVFN